MYMLSYKERISRLINTDYIVEIENGEIHEILSVTRIKDSIHAYTGYRFFKDTDIMTLQEYSNSSLLMEQIQKSIKS